MLLGELKVDGLTLDPDKRWHLVFLQNTPPYTDLEQAIERELAKDNSDHAQQNADQIIGAIDAVNATASPEYIGTFSRLLPLNCSDEGVQQVTDILEGDKALNPLMEKSLKNRRDGNQRCQAISRLLAERNQG